MERQLLNWERAGGHGATFKALEGTLWLDNPAGSFQGGDEPLPSTRAAVVLSAVKYGWWEEALTDRYVNGSLKVAPHLVDRPECGGPRFLPQENCPTRPRAGLSVWAACYRNCVTAAQLVAVRLV
jgi:hypothetical protein